MNRINKILTFLTGLALATNINSQSLDSIIKKEYPYNQKQFKREYTIYYHQIPVGEATIEGKSYADSYKITATAGLYEILKLLIKLDMRIETELNLKDSTRSFVEQLPLRNNYECNHTIGKEIVIIKSYYNKKPHKEVKKELPTQNLYDPVSAFFDILGKINENYSGTIIYPLIIDTMINKVVSCEISNNKISVDIGKSGITMSGVTKLEFTLENKEVTRVDAYLWNTNQKVVGKLEKTIN